MIDSRKVRRVACAAAAALMIWQLTPPTPALAAKASLDDLAACQSDEAPPSDRIEKCSLVIGDNEQPAEIRAEAFLNRGISREASDDLKGALADYGEAIKLNPEYAAPYVYRGMALELDGQSDKALVDLTQALKLEPENVEALSVRGGILLAMGKLDDAIRDFTDAIRLAPDDSDTWASRGEAYERKGEREKALSDFRKALELEPDHQAAKAGFGRLGSRT